MNLKKNLGRIATAFVATAMLASLTAVPASAEAQDGVFETISENKITMTKNLEMPADAVVPQATFKFDIKPGTPTADEKYIDSNGVSIPVTAGTVTQTDAGTATIAANQSTDTTGAGAGNKIASVDFDLTLPTETYSEVGVYKYTIDEQDETVDEEAGFSDQTVSLDLYLIVTRDNNGGVITNDDTFVVSAAVIKVPGSETGEKAATWTNYYKLDDDGKSEVGTITVQKKIAGAMGNKSDEFEFTVGGLTQDVEYTYTINDVPQEDTLNTNNNTVTLGHEDTLKVVGLDHGANITITEEIPSGSGYTCTEITGDTDDNKENGITLTVNKEEVQSTVFTNSRNAVSPTGIVMDVAPYALLVVVAAAGCFVFLRKRRED